MTRERHAAFKMVRDYINGIADAKLFDHERELLDNAAEDLLLAQLPDDAAQARETAVVMLDTLVESGRWTAPMRAQMLSLLDACGPARRLIGA